MTTKRMNFKVGQVVTAYRRGVGVVTTIKPSAQFGVVVQFKHGKDYYTSDGRLWTSDPITLHLGRGVVTTKFTPTTTGENNHEV